MRFGLCIHGELGITLNKDQKAFCVHNSLPLERSTQKCKMRIGSMHVKDWDNGNNWTTYYLVWEHQMEYEWAKMKSLEGFASSALDMTISQ